MITLKANNTDILNIQTELDLKVGGIKELSSPIILEELANAVFTLSAKSFIKAMNIESKSNPSAYHHIYEWQRLGTTSGKLFFLRKTNSKNGKLIINPGFIKSKTKVPVSPELLSPGKTGKSVASKHIFKDKAFIMESGKPIIYRTRKNTPIPDKGELKFVAAGTVLKNYNPGGKQVKGSFEKFYNYWYSSKINSVIDSSGIIQKIDQETAKILNNKGSGSREVKSAIINLLKQYSKGVEIA
jgi:hypothetical protein